MCVYACCCSCFGLALAQFIFELFSLAAWQFCYFTGSQNVEMKNCHDRAENGHVVVALVAYILVNVFLCWIVYGSMFVFTFVLGMLFSHKLIAKAKRCDCVGCTVSYEYFLKVKMVRVCIFKCVCSKSAAKFVCLCK